MLTTLKIKLYQLLRRSEKWTGTDMIYLTKNSFWLTGSKIIGTLTAMGLAVTYANLLPAKEYATYKYVISIISLLAIFSLPGINTSLIRSVARGLEGSVKEGIKTKIKWSLLGALVGIIISVYYFYQNNIVLGLGFLIATLSVTIINNLVYGPILQGKKLFKVSSIYTVINQIILAGAIILAIWFSPKALTLISVFYLATLAVQSILFIITFKKYPLNNKKDPAAISFGKHLSLMGVIGVIAGQADKILMWHLLGATQLAIYSFATLPIIQIKSLLKSISTIAFPKITAQNPELIKKTLPKKIAKFMAILIIPIIIYILLAPYIYKILFPQYLEAVKYSQLFALTLIFFPQRLLGQTLVAYAQTKSLYILKIINPLTKILFLILGIYFLNIKGAILAIILSSIVSLIFSFLFFKKI